jgi:pyruvate,orthophosphate dikinase
MSDTRYVYDFSEGSREQKDLLGGKGANLAEMTRLGLPLPPGFTIRSRQNCASRSPQHCADSRMNSIDGWAIYMTLCSCPCARAQCSRCRA